MKSPLKLFLIILLLLIFKSSLLFSQEITFFITSDSLCDSNVNDYIYDCKLSYNNPNRFIGALDQKIIEVDVDTIASSIIVIGSGNIMSYYVEDLKSIGDSDLFGELLLLRSLYDAPEKEPEYVQFYISFTQKEITITKSYDGGYFSSQCLKFSGYF